MIQLDEFLKPVYETERLGFDIKNPKYIPEDYIDNKFFVLFRTCQSFGDWAIISAIPRLLKTKYIDSLISIPSPTLIKKLYPTGMWTNKHENFHNNVVEVFINNPYIDGMIDELPNEGVYHDHFRIYDTENLNIPLTEQMLLYWRFHQKEVVDSAPELYWSDDEKREGYGKVAELFKGEAFGFLYIDDSFFEIHDNGRELLSYKRKRIQEKIDEFPNLKWLYYAGKDISETPYKTHTKTVDVRSLKVSNRIQNYIKSLSWILIGHQGGYGSDCMSRYPVKGCQVVPLAAKYINEHFIRSTNYLLPTTI